MHSAQQELMMTRLPPDRDYKELEWEDQFLDLPVLRMISSNGT
jgi:hypothetical protein